MNLKELTPAQARGKVAKSENGVLGIITEYRYHPTFTGWEGIGLDGSLWRSTRPTIVARSVLEYVESTLAEEEAAGP
jgi:hypothetical protein